MIGDLIAICVSGIDRSEADLRHAIRISVRGRAKAYKGKVLNGNVTKEASHAPVAVPNRDPVNTRNVFRADRSCRKRTLKRSRTIDRGKERPISLR